MVKMKIMVMVCLCAAIVVGCASLKASKQIIPVKEYEKMIAGRLDADYIGATRCLAACHSHDRIKRDFEASTMGAQLSKKSGMPLVDCESCHGPGSLAVEGITAEKVEEEKRQGKETACRHETLIDLKNLPGPAQSLICLKCHTANSTFNLHNWNAGVHATSDVSCSDCHRIHSGADLKVKPRDSMEMCVRCHEEVKAEASLFSRHPLNERKIFCTDCHDAHGSPYGQSLKRSTEKEVCTQCHADKEGPFVYEHADLTEECSACHSPHGSVNNYLLNARTPFLCLQCHEGHRTSSAQTQFDRKGAYYGNCTDCHSRIHGTDIPSASGMGRFTQ